MFARVRSQQFELQPEHIYRQYYMIYLRMLLIISGDQGCLDETPPRIEFSATSRRLQS